MKIINRLFCFIVIFLMLILFQNFVMASEVFIEKLPVYGLIKPARISTLLAVNHGIVSKVPLQIGDLSNLGDIVLVSIEKETTRSYRSSIYGKIAKLHVTEGAALTPGMPLVTIVNPDFKSIEVHLSPNEATLIKLGTEVFIRDSDQLFGTISKISPIVDPDTGSVLSYVAPKQKVNQLIGDILSVDIKVREIKDCDEIKPIHQLDQFLSTHRVEAVTGKEVCLKLKN